MSLPMNVRNSPELELTLAALLALGTACPAPESELTDDGISETGEPIAGDTEESTGEVDTTGGETGDSTEETGDSCGGELWTATTIVSNMLIVQDRSGSMDEHIDDMTKWEIAKEAIEHVVTAQAGQVFFGLMLYPGVDDSCNEGMSCAPGNIFVDPGPDTAPQIIDALANADTCSLGTPTAETLTPLRDYAGLQDLARPNYILLITDGQSTCADPVPEVEALLLEEPTIKTFVVGFGEGVDPDQLNDMAVAGGTALDDDVKYYQASDAQALEDAFADIALDLFSCSYVLDQVPPNPDDLYIYIDGVLIERDQTHTNGWDYDLPSNRVTFYGGSCDQLQTGQTEGLEIIFGCPTIG